MFLNIFIGLCGDFNDNENDDFKNPQDMIEVEEVAFVNSWKVRDSC